MAFTSLRFYAWLGAALVLFYAVPRRGRPWALVALSCLYYAAASPAHFAILAGATVLVRAVGTRLAAATTDRARTAWLAVGLVPVVGTLVAFKAGSAASGLLLPLGLSYYTFKLAAHLLEVYWDETKLERRAVDLAAFATFAPQIPSGPIQRSADFFAELEALRGGPASPEKIERGLRLLLGGLLLKLVLGDRIGAFAAIVDRAPEAFAWPVLATRTLCYMLHLYADFAGYTNIALGVGLLFGIEGPPNFAAPFAATGMPEFWRRWHMSLTTWLGDYVFTPLRMATRRWGRFGLALSIMANMVLIGVWHGFAWTYLVFGLIHGVYLVVAALWPVRASRARLAAPLAAAAAVGTYLLMTFTQIFFQAPSMGASIVMLKLLAGIAPTGAKGFADVRADVAGPLLPCMAIVYWLGAGAPGLRPVAALALRRVPNWMLYGFALLVLSVFATEEGTRFIYGQF